MDPTNEESPNGDSGKALLGILVGCAALVTFAHGYRHEKRMVALKKNYKDEVRRSLTKRSRGTQ